ncbi:MAG: hypothetical protein CBC29_05340 [Methylococcaceae bacterium TMED69]|nr:MAG: hypothetical protein CBC29_05340 [Methylococcaceae bacterium TMED69]|tara:strand:- start:415 stop:1494 length:1080 start_codon:yes stop_codon:yes gene_type:complete
MSDFLLQSFISECKDIASGLDRLGSKWPKTYEDSSFIRNMVKEELDYRLYRYQSVDNGRKKTLKKKIKTVLIIYSLINRATIVDLQRNESLVGDLLDSDCDVFLLDWKEFGDGTLDLSLSDYSFRFIEECVDFIKNTTCDSDINLVGLCQGGVFSLLYTLKNKNKVRSLALMSTPIDFKTKKDTMSKILEHINLDHLYSIPYVSGSMLNSFFNMLAPYSVLQKKYLTLIEKQDDPGFVENFFLMENWRMDSPKVSGAVLAEFIKTFYLRNSFLNGNVEVKSSGLALEVEIDFPVLNLYGLRDRLVPPEASKALVGLVSNQLLYSEVPFNCGHIGMFTFREKELTPGKAIGMWLCQESRG